MEILDNEELIKEKSITNNTDYSDLNEINKDSLDKSNVGDLSNIKQREFNKFIDAATNNNHHVVPVGVLIVLVTIYLGMNGIQKCVVTCTENQAREEVKMEEAKIINWSPLKDSQQHILERLLEYKDICKDLEVFTKNNNINNYTFDDEKQKILRFGTRKKTKQIISSGGSGSGSGSGTGDCAKSYSKRIKKTKHLIKLPTNGKNGFHKYNKSTKAKFVKMDKKELNLNKKNSTAEPIIYLFALVFLYLLLKAASDINQHYKSQTKNDKRLRRCSLQSYAQAHRPDRRASKASELALKQKQQRLLAISTRSICMEQPSQYPQHLYHHRYVEDSPKKPTPSTPPNQLSLRTRTSGPNNWQLLRQHITTQSVDNSDIISSHVTKPDAVFSSQEYTSIRNRRCSVPVALNYTPRQVPTSLPLGIHNNNDPLSNRRTSISMPLDAVDGMGNTEIKRRVRMINRH